MYSARDIFTMSLLLADFDRAALRVEGDERIAEQPFDVAAARHIRGRKVAQHGWVDQGDRVAERKGDVQFVRREEDALAVVVCQPSQQRAEFVTVRQVEERGRFVEQDDRGVLGQGPGDHYPLAFAVGHAVHRFPAKAAMPTSSSERSTMALSCSCTRPIQLV